MYEVHIWQLLPVKTRRWQDPILCDYYSEARHAMLDRMHQWLGATGAGVDDEKYSVYIHKGQARIYLEESALLRWEGRVIATSDMLPEVPDNAFIVRTSASRFNPVDQGVKIYATWQDAVQSLVDSSNSMLHHKLAKAVHDVMHTGEAQDIPGYQVSESWNPELAMDVVKIVSAAREYTLYQVELENDTTPRFKGTDGHTDIRPGWAGEGGEE